MIPKIIHYCWFGNTKQSLLIKRCIASWKLRLPDYEFILWNESNFNPNTHNFPKTAYNSKKYAFVSDYARMNALKKYGGIYLDTDVEVLKSLNPLLDYDFFIGLEKENDFGTNVIGCKPNHWLPNQMLDLYDSTTFQINDLKSMVNVGHVSKCLLKRGFTGSNTKQIINNELVLPIGFLSDAHKQSKTAPHIDRFTHHHYAGSWKNSNKHFLSRTNRYLKKQFFSDFKSIIKIITYSVRTYR